MVRWLVRGIRCCNVAFVGSNRACIGGNAPFGVVAPTPPPTDIAPNLKVTTSQGYEVNVAGTMQSMSGLRIQYKRQGGSGWATVGFLTNLPGSFEITPFAPGQSEMGNLRAIFIKKNVDFGDFSPEYPVTLS